MRTLVGLFLCVFVLACHAQTVIYSPATSDTNGVTVTIPGSAEYVANVQIIYPPARTSQTSNPGSVSYLFDTSNVLTNLKKTARVEPQEWDVPVPSRAVISWKPSPDTARTIFEIRSIKTTNQWVRIWPEEQTPNSAVLTLDLSTPVESRVIAVTEGGAHAEPSLPLRHPAIIVPKPHTNLKLMYQIKLDEHHELMVRRGKVEPTIVYPPLPP